MNEAAVTPDQAGDALVRAFRLTYQALDLLKIGDGSGDFRGSFMSAFRTLAVYVAKADGRLSPDERTTIDHIFWLDHGDPDATSRANADDPGAIETAIQFLCTMTAAVHRANAELAKPTDSGSNQLLLAADKVFCCVRAAGDRGSCKPQRLDAVMSRIRQAVPVTSATTQARPPASAPAATSPVAEIRPPSLSPSSVEQAMSLPSVACPARLHAGETCHATTSVVLFQESSVVRNVRYSGLSGRVGIIRGLSFRSGSYSVDRTRAPKIEPIAAGTLCITNQRLIFLSDTRNLDLPLAKLLSCQTEPGIIEVSRANSGRLLFEQADEQAIEIFEQVSGTSPDHRLAPVVGHTWADRERAHLRRGRSLAAVIVISLLLMTIYIHLAG